MWGQTLADAWFRVSGCGLREFLRGQALTDTRVAGISEGTDPCGIPERTKVAIEVEVAEKVAEKFSETEERIIASIQANPHITQKMLSDTIGLTRQYVGRCMDSLQARNIIRRVGPDKGGYWEVLK